jgi:hypothetical protein
MKTDSEIRTEGMSVLLERLGPAEADRFITLVRRDGFDYTEWRQNLFEEKSVGEILAVKISPSGEEA